MKGRSKTKHNSIGDHRVMIPIIGIVGSIVAVILNLVGWSGQLFGWPGKLGLLIGFCITVVIGAFAFGGFLAMGEKKIFSPLMFFFPRIRYGRQLSQALIHLLILIMIGIFAIAVITSRNDGLVPYDATVFGEYPIYTLTSRGVNTVVSQLRYRIVGISWYTGWLLAMCLLCLLSIHCLCFGELAVGGKGREREVENIK